MKVSIITVCYNSQKTIEKTLKSVLSQTYNNIEYIIIDGLSVDHTRDILTSYEKKFIDKGIEYKIISEKDSGIYNAMNKGIYVATGNLVGIINSDDWYEANAIKTAVTIYHKNPYDILCGGTYIWKKEQLYKEKKVRNRRYVTSRDWSHPGMFVKRDYYKSKGVYKENVFYADLDFYFRSRKNGANIVFTSAVLSNFRLGGISNRKKTSELIMRIKDRYQVYRNNGYGKYYFLESCVQEILKYILS